MLRVLTRQRVIGVALVIGFVGLASARTAAASTSSAVAEKKSVSRRSPVRAFVAWKTSLVAEPARKPSIDSPVNFMVALRRQVDACALRR